MSDVMSVDVGNSVDVGLSYIEEMGVWDKYFQVVLSGGLFPLYEGVVPLDDEDECDPLGFLRVGYFGLNDFTVDAYASDADLTFLGSVRVDRVLKVAEVSLAIDDLMGSGVDDHFVYFVDFDFLKIELNDHNACEVFLAAQLSVLVNKMYEVV